MESKKLILLAAFCALALGGTLRADGSFPIPRSGSSNKIPKESEKPTGTRQTSGGDHSGGGQSIVATDGSVRFLDMIPESQLPKEAMSSQDITAQFYAPHRYVKRIAVEDPQFFVCAIEKMDARGLPAFNRLRPLLQKLKPLIVQFRIPLVADDADAESLNLPYAAAPSERVSPSLQEPLASYVKGRLWVSARMLGAMRADDQCAAGVHEGLRHLNFAKILEAPLSTAEIEVATRWVMDASEKDDPVDAVLAKLRNTTKTTEDWRQLAHQRFEDSDKLFQYKIAHAGTMSAEEIKQLNRQAYQLDLEVANAWSNSIGETMNEVNSEASLSSGIGLKQGAALTTGMTSPGCFDVIQLKDVSRLHCL